MSNLKSTLQKLSKNNQTVSTTVGNGASAHRKGLTGANKPETFCTKNNQNSNTHVWQWLGIAITIALLHFLHGILFMLHHFTLCQGWMILFYIAIATQVVTCC